MGSAPKSEMCCTVPRCAGGQSSFIISTSLTARCRAFTMIDVLVTISVIAVLLAILMPALTMVREATRRVVCSSNQKQIGYGLVMFTDDHKGNLPPSEYSAKAATDPNAAPHRMMVARLDDGSDRWDGVGHLFDQSYLSTPGVFYCPSHHGEHAYARYNDDWDQPGTGSGIMTNFQYRGGSPDGSSNVARIAANYPNLSLLTDGLSSQSDYNHNIGCNVLRLDTSVSWYSDEGGHLARSLAAFPGDPSALARVRSAWNVLDLGNPGVATPEVPAGPG